MEGKPEQKHNVLCYSSNKVEYFYFMIFLHPDELASLFIEISSKILLHVVGQSEVSGVV